MVKIRRKSLITNDKLQQTNLNNYFKVISKTDYNLFDQISQTNKCSESTIIRKRRRPKPIIESNSSDDEYIDCDKIAESTCNTSIHTFVVERRKLPVELPGSLATFDDNSNNKFLMVTIETSLKMEQNNMLINKEDLKLSMISPEANTVGAEYANEGCIDTAREFSPSPTKLTKQQNCNETLEVTITSDKNFDEIKFDPWVLTHIKTMIQYALSQSNFQMLLTKEEKQSLDTLVNLPNNNYLLVCLKLFMRAPKWYNVSKLKDLLKLEMNDNEVEEMYQHLKFTEFICFDYSSETCLDLLNHLMLKDIKDICSQFRLKAKCTLKSKLIDLLLKNSHKQQTLSQFCSTEQILRKRINEKMGCCIKRSQYLYDILYKIHTLYSFTNPEFTTPSDLHLFMGKLHLKDIVLPPYTVHITTPVFTSRENFLSFVNAHQIKTQFLIALDKKDVNGITQNCRVAYKELQILVSERLEEERPHFLRRFSAAHKYVSTLSTGSENTPSEYAEEACNWLELILSQKLYCISKRGKWYDRLALIQYNYLKQYEKAAKTVIRGLKDDLVHEIGLHQLSHRGAAIKNSKSRQISEMAYNEIEFSLLQPADVIPFPMNVIDARAEESTRIGSKRKYIERRDDGETLVLSVEEFAIRHYEQNGFEYGLHCEGSLLTTLFCILFWDIIYMDLPNIFLSEIQSLPLDLDGVEFYNNRKEAIDERLEDIESQWSTNTLNTFICDIWNKHSHEKSLMHSDFIDQDNICDIVNCIGRKVLVKILERLVKDFRMCQSGLPDLFLWNNKLSKCKFVEVKGHKDKLSIKQKLWLHFLRSVGADIAVCLVHTIGSRGTEKLKKKKE